MDMLNRAHAEVPAPIPIQFLRRFHPAGLWVLSAIHPETEKIQTRTFSMDEEARAAEWVAKKNEQHNLYFSVNLPNRKLSKKASRQDIHTVPWLHADIDARAGEPLKDELKRILLLLTDRCPTLPPTVILFSGGGYQAFWKLRVPFKTDGHIELAEEIARYNRQLVNDLGGDINCPNADRIMRLPGTMNFPNAKKLARGRVKAEAEIYSYEESLVYDLAQFAQAPETASKSASQREQPAADVAAIPLKSIDDLDQWQISERTKRIIAQGRIPDQPKKRDDSRSAWLFEAVCDLKHKNVPDGVIMGVILDPKFEISASVLEKRSGAKAYALRQVARARTSTQQYKRNSDMKILRTMQNVQIALARHGDEIRYNELAQCEYINGERVGDEVINGIWGDVAQHDLWEMPQQLLRDTVLYEARQNRYHPVLEYLDSLTWDQVARVDTWLSVYLGVEDTPYTRAVGRLLLVAAVRRVRVPGCKFDFMIVFEGSQGTGKSTVLVIMSVNLDWFTDHVPLDEGQPRLVESLQGTWIAEASELAGLRHADVSKLKTFLSARVDKVRPAYGHKVKYFARQCIVVGTTNDNSYLRDATGNRRYLPVKTGTIDLDGLRLVRDQLWAEAVCVESLPDTELVLPRKVWPEAARQQQQRMERPPCFDQIEAALDGWDDAWVPVESIRDLVNNGGRDWHGNRHMGQAMSLLGWQKFKKREDGKMVHAYGKGSRAQKWDPNVRPSAAAEYDLSEELF